MPRLEVGQRALITAPTLSTIPQYEATTIGRVMQTQVETKGGRKFRLADLEAVGITDHDRRAGCFIPRLIPEWHPDYPAARDQHCANVLQSQAYRSIKGWQRFPQDPQAAEQAATSLLILSHYLKTNTEDPHP